MMKMREAFSMFMAITVVLMMAIISMLVFNMSGKMVKITSTQFRKAQAELLAKSYTELAVLAVINHNRQGTTPPSCVEQINGVVNGVIPNAVPTGSSTAGSGYDVRTYIYYIGTNLPCSPNKILNSMTIQTDYNSTNPPHADSVAAIIVDVYVRYKDPSMVDTYATSNGAPPTPTQIPWITYHRRTLQKI